MRDHSVYAASCLKCGVEIESKFLPVPELCIKCSNIQLEERRKKLLMDKPGPVRARGII